MEGFWKYLVFVTVLLLALGLIFVFRNCSFKIDSDELWYEEVDVYNGAYICVYHNDSCRRKKPLFAKTKKKIDYQKHKFDVLDFCFHNEEDIKMMSAISKRNIKDYLDNAWIFIEDENDREFYKWNCEVLDTMPCDNSTIYAMKGENLIKLSSPRLAPINIEKK